MNRFGSHSPPLAASSARVSGPDVLLTAARERLTVSSRNTPPLGAGILYCTEPDAYQKPYLHSSEHFRTVGEVVARVRVEEDGEGPMVEHEPGDEAGEVGGGEGDLVHAGGVRADRAVV